MPVYERRCGRCKEVFSHLCKVADREQPRTCTLCGNSNTTPIMSATPTTFKFADAKAIKTVVRQNRGYGKLTGKDAKYYTDKWYPKDRRGESG